MYEELTPKAASPFTENGRGLPQTEFQSKQSAEALRRDLESELKLDNSDVRSHGWYHGRLPRDVADGMMKYEGDFLIRESVSNPGEFVLSMRWNNAALHFKINQVLYQQGALPPRVQYQFERDCFDSIPALIMYHFGKSIPISIASGAIIKRPVNRNLPLSFSDAKYASLRRNKPSIKSSGDASQSYPRSTSLSSSPLSSESSSTNADFNDPRAQLRHRSNVSPEHPLRRTKDPLPFIPNAHNVARSPTERVVSAGFRHSSSPKPFPLTIDSQTETTDGPAPLLNVPRAAQRPSSQIDVKGSNHVYPVGSRSGSEPQLSPTKARPEEDGLGPLPAKQSRPQRTNASPEGPVSVPPKPSRVPSFRKPVIRHQGESKSADNSPMVKENVRGLRENPSATPKKQSMVRFRGESTSEPSTPLTTQPAPYRSSAADLQSNPKPPTELRNSAHVKSLLKDGNEVGANFPIRAELKSQPSAFDLQTFVSSLLPIDNKPVEGSVLIEIKKLLLGTDPFKLARHLTFVDCKVCRVEENGLRDILLSKGAQLRKDIMERYQCTAFWVAVMVLRGCGTLEERVDMLNVFIQVANELVHSLGNVFGFSSLMAGLCCPQLCDIHELWTTLQRRYTNNSVTMEKKLRPLLKFLDEGKGQIDVVSACIPHIIPIVRFYENPLKGIPHNAPKPCDIKKLSASEGDMLGSVASTGGNTEATNEWWRNLPDDSFDSLMAQLQASRSVLNSLVEFRQNTKAKLRDFETNAKLCEIFATEFHLKLLWGSKGAEVTRLERYQKFDRVVSAMAKRLLS